MVLFASQGPSAGLLAAEGGPMYVAVSQRSEVDFGSIDIQVNRQKT